MASAAAAPAGPPSVDATLSQLEAQGFHPARSGRAHLRVVAAALGVPRAYPSTVLVRADGTVAAVLPRVFESPDEVADVRRFPAV